jgi:formiminotetrahydrofolate cyclodeaminase
MAAQRADARRAAADDRGELASAIARLASVHVRLLALADDDSVAYASVLAAYRLPKGTDGERDTRTAAIQIAMEAATDAPLRVMEGCGQVLREAVLIAERVPAAAKTDFAIGIELLDASLRGCGMCVRANVALLRSADVVERVTLAAAEIQTAAAGHLGRIRVALATG